MKPVKLMLILIFITIFLAGCIEKESPINIIPKPNKVVRNSGSFSITGSTKIFIPNGENENIFPAKYLVEKIYHAWGYNLEVITSDLNVTDDYILLNYSDILNLNSEGYILRADSEKIILNARNGSGMFYAVQTLLQLLPNEIFGNNSANVIDLVVPSVEVTDQPRFSYRGMHLDVGRNFFSASFIKRYIDYLAIHKINTFHWHLTEDQGWRIEIKKYPKLASISSVRKETIVGKTSEFDGKEYGGYYTQDEIKEIVKYAEERFITIIPEIEMPGHTVAVLAAYPEYACTKGPFVVSTKWGVKNNIFCAGKESTFDFIEDVLTEVIELFPSKYIHIGGDEAPKSRWKNCKNCQKRIKNEGLDDEHGLQSYFITRIEKFLNSKGRKIIGWDEILEGGLAPDATVMSWRGTEGGVAAAKKNHDVIMVPYSHLYFDGYQGAYESEPLAIGYWAPIERVYSFDPVPEELTLEQKKHIIGAEATLWTEYISTEDYAEYMLLPRLAALSEIVWSKKEDRSWENFEKRLQSQYKRYISMGVNFRIPTPGIEKFVSLEEGEKLEIKNQIDVGKVCYTFDGSAPSLKSQIYTTPIQLSENVIIKSASILPNGRSSSVISSTIMLENLLPEGKKYGLTYKYYEGEFNEKMPDFSTLAPVDTGYIKSITLKLKKRRYDQFAVKFEGYLVIDSDGDYTFDLISDDGCKLFLDSSLVVGTENYITEPIISKMQLTKGLHPLTIEYYDWRGAENISIKYAGPEIISQTIPAYKLVVDSK